MNNLELSAPDVAGSLRDQAEICLAALSRMSHRPDLHQGLLALAAELIDRAKLIDPDGQGSGHMVLAALHGKQ